MRAVCKKTTSNDFDLKIVTTVLSNQFDYTFGGYGLELNKTYLIMGIRIQQNNSCLYYLIDTNGKPDWFPYLLFDIIDGSLPQNWFFKINNNNSDAHVVFGFDELCNDDGFYYKLIDRDHDATQIYFRRKIEFEKELDEI